MQWMGVCNLLPLGGNMLALPLSLPHRLLSFPFLCCSTPNVSRSTSKENHHAVEETSHHSSATMRTFCNAGSNPHSSWLEASSTAFPKAAITVWTTYRMPAIALRHYVAYEHRSTKHDKSYLCVRPTCFHDEPRNIHSR